MCAAPFSDIVRSTMSAPPQVLSAFAPTSLAQADTDADSCFAWTFLLKAYSLSDAVASTRAAAFTTQSGNDQFR